MKECWESGIDAVADDHPDGLSIVERAALGEMRQVAYETGIDDSIATVVEDGVPAEYVVSHGKLMEMRQKRIELDGK